MLGLEARADLKAHDRGQSRLSPAQRFLEELREGWESIRIEPHEFIEAGEDVVVPLTIHGRGRDGSSCGLARPRFQVIERVFNRRPPSIPIACPVT